MLPLLRRLGDFIAHCGIRCVLWLVTILGAVFPALWASGADIDSDVVGIVAKVNQANLFRDLFYIVIVIALLGTCNIIYNIAMNERRIDLWVALSATIGFAYFLYVLVYGTGRFSHLAQSHTALPLPELNHDLNVILLTGVVGLSTEIVIALRDEAERISRR